MKPFSLNTSDEDFVRRQKSVFDQLTTLENNHSTTSSNFDSPPMETDVETDNKRSHSKNARRVETKQFRGRESIFKKPREQPLTKNFIKRMPDFKRNPHKWVKYTLSDVKDEDMSDKSNTKAALSFLNELKGRNSTDDAEVMEEDVPKKIMFTPKITKPTPSIVKDEEKDDKPTFQSSKIVMPEYVVGHKINKEKKNRSIKAGKQKELKLDHLLDEEDE